MYVKEMMTTDVVTCNSDSNLETAAKLMWDNDCGSVAITDESGAPIGVITDRDIAMSCALNHKAQWEISAKEVLNSRQLHTCVASEDIRTALKIMAQYHVRRLPVVNKDGKLQGILSIDDVISFTDTSPAAEKAMGFSVTDTVGALKSLAKHH